MEISLASLNVQAYTTELSEVLKSWQEDFFQLKKEIYTRLNPKANLCFFSIYGFDFDEVLKLYLDIFTEKAFDISMQSIWFRESFYTEEIDDINIEGEPIKRKREEYIKKVVKVDRISAFKAPRKGDKLCGVEFTITGECSYLFLKDEIGLQKWKSGNNKISLFDIGVANEAFKTPTEIHRKGYYTKQTPKRIIELNTIKDNSLGLNREYNKNDLTSLLLDCFDKRFEQNLNSELL